LRWLMTISAEAENELNKTRITAMKTIAVIVRIGVSGGKVE
jgi:hypothetical protein